ncbi:MAG: hypothetical protein HY562_07160 [Ignavibacteriales bacterium]|nr:hypothetical protein [Ignavibacteriales bacterium]
MAFSDQAFASEIIAVDGTAYKFDDIECMEKFRAMHSEVAIAQEFYKDYRTKAWVEKGRAIIVETGIKTPMGSGKVAVSDSLQAKAIVGQYPAAKPISENSSGCGADCCGEKEN